MPRFKLTIEYAGTRYHGWQYQKNARTVAGEILAAAAKLGHTGELYGSGRTDAGVHALAQVAHLDLDTTRAPDALAFALNDALPPDINVRRVERVPHRFHARHDAQARSYLYQIARRRTAFQKPFVWWVKDALDVERMARVIPLFSGRHDFRSFSADDPEDKSTRVEVEGMELVEAGELILFRVRGSHFVWKMVRRLVGVLAEVGRGRLDANHVARFLVEDSAAPAQLTAPPSGLFLERVFYAGDGPALPLCPAFDPSREESAPPKRGGRR